MKAVAICILGILATFAMFVVDGYADVSAWMPGDTMFVGTGGCALSETLDGPVKGTLEPKAYVTVRQMQGDMAEVAKGDSRVGWVPKSCLMTTEDFFKNPACFRSSWMEKSVQLDAAGSESAARMVPVGEDGGRYLLEIIDPTGRTLWRSSEAVLPNSVSAPRSMEFFCGPEGDYWPLFLGDLNGDGRAELLLQEPHTSSERARALYLYRWDGRGFAPIVSGRCLLREGNVFRWTACPEDVPEGAQWLDGLYGVTADGVSIWSICAAPGGDEARACVTGRFRLRDDGFAPLP